MNAEREVVDIGLLSSEIEDSNLWVGDTTVESGLRIWLKVTKVSFSGLQKRRMIADLSGGRLFA